MRRVLLLLALVVQGTSPQDQDVGLKALLAGVDLVARTAALLPRAALLPKAALLAAAKPPLRPVRRKRPDSFGWVAGRF
jgi:hypothetical protein